MAFSNLFIFLILLGSVVITVIAAIVALIVLLVRHANRQTAASAPAPESAKRPLSEILRELRTRAGMTQEYVAEALDISRQAVSKWESGASEPTSANLSALAELYGVPEEELMRSR